MATCSPALYQGVNRTLGGELPLQAVTQPHEYRKKTPTGGYFPLAFISNRPILELCSSLPPLSRRLGQMLSFLVALNTPTTRRFAPPPAPCEGRAVSGDRPEDRVQGIVSETIQRDTLPGTVSMANRPTWGRADGEGGRDVPFPCLLYLWLNGLCKIHSRSETVSRLFCSKTRHASGYCASAVFIGWPPLIISNSISQKPGSSSWRGSSTRGTA